jgi:hypothetical protein
MNESLSKKIFRLTTSTALHQLTRHGAMNVAWHKRTCLLLCCVCHGMLNSYTCKTLVHVVVVAIIYSRSIVYDGTTTPRNYHHENGQVKAKYLVYGR